MNVSLPLTVADRFAWIIRELHAAVAARIRFPPVTGTMIVFICARLRRIAAEFSALAAKIRAGTYVQRPTGRRCVARRTSRASRSVVRTHYELGLPPWRSAWLHRVAPGDAGVWAGALRDLFSDPEMAALISATPRMRRILRPLCFMLGLEASLLTPPPSPAVTGEERANACVAPTAAVAPDRPPTVETSRAPEPMPWEKPPTGAIFGLA